ncbi:Bug family tripartite tricarboxylate transporter substrate binding protein [Allopusillimonas ginsengisoli]|uniref:Bug family tripartite tricarboxylate transporter substrate binding protein n=1 Tax=Allopusillimonas ginsengisoli TaxID=453575 RepID=UPI00101FE6CF|nr:tripartite tricarboxylate transporter substrate binding protein [Allopusillimonas ginsengisoli]TEA69453.1 tripartite tricarboxylate transporter substrate binding protein [Allopusillimonas ginsengisoli]
MYRFLSRILRFAVVCLLGAACSAHASGYPHKPVVIVVPFAAGGATDQLARLLGQRLGEVLGQPFIIENKPGAGTVIAAAGVARAAADGYTLFLAPNSTLTLNPALRTQIPYDPIKSYSFIGQVATLDMVLVANINEPERTLQDMLERARSRPQSLSYGSFGVGTTANFGGEMLKAAAHVDIMHVPFNGSTPNLTAVIGNQIPLAVDTIVATLPFIRAGKMRAIAILSPHRPALLPDVPTVAESGFPGFELMSWLALIAPAGIPEPVRLTLDTALQSVLAEANMQKQLRNLGLTPAYTPGVDVLAKIRKELPLMQKVAASAHMPTQ